MTETNLAEPEPANVLVNGAAVRSRRKELGFTVIGFARRVPMSFGYLSQIERGTRPAMSPPKFRQLVEALGMTDRADELVKAAA